MFQSSRYSIAAATAAAAAAVDFADEFIDLLL